MSTTKAAGQVIHDKRANESMQTILIVAFGALLLLGLNRFWNENSHRVQKPVETALSQSWKIDSEATNSSDNDPSIDNPIDLHDAAKVAADLASEFRDAAISKLENELGVTLPKRAEMLDDAIENIRRKLSELGGEESPIAKKLEDLLAKLKKERFVDLVDQGIGLGDRVKMQGQLNDILGSVGRMIGMDEMFAQDRTNHAINRDPNSTLQDRYQAFEATFGIAGDQLVSGVVDLASSKLKNPNSKPGTLTNLGISIAANEIGKEIAAASFKPFNNFSYWLWDNGYSPRPPAFPRDFDPERDLKP